MNPPAAALVALLVLAAWAAPVHAAGDEPAVAATTYTHVGPTPPPRGYPVIKAITMSSADVHAGGAVRGTVETSDNVKYVEARINYRSVPLHEDAPGKFSLTYTVPWWLPPWLRHGYTLQIVARSVDGVEAWRGIPIMVH